VRTARARSLATDSGRLMRPRHRHGARATPRFPRAAGTPRRVRRPARRTAQPRLRGRPRPVRLGRLRSLSGIPRPSCRCPERLQAEPSGHGARLFPREPEGCPSEHVDLAQEVGRRSSEVERVLDYVDRRVPHTPDAGRRVALCIDEPPTWELQGPATCASRSARSPASSWSSAMASAVSDSLRCPQRACRRAAPLRPARIRRSRSGVGRSYACTYGSLPVRS
jgi:hypothetical protein